MDVKPSFRVDWGAITVELATAQATLELAEDPQYMDILTDTGFYKAEREFNLKAAAVAQSDTTINHMFEWGTLGVNKGRANRRPRPDKESARLWNSVITGSGGSKKISFVYKPSNAFVPLPTAGESGMSTEVISRMRKHIFYNKAMVFETGQEVVIERKEAKFLLIPVTESTWKYMKPYDLRRGYALEKGPLVVTPGKRYSGHFTAFWMRFWTERFPDIEEEQIYAAFDSIQRYSSWRPGSSPARPAGSLIVSKKTRAEVSKIKRQAKTRAKRVETTMRMEAEQ